MKLTKTKLTQLIKEELENLDDAGEFDERKRLISRVYDGFVYFLEAEKKFPRGEIPKPVLDAITLRASTIVDGMQQFARGASLEAASAPLMPGKEAPGEPDELDTDPWRAKMGPR